jgi:methionyl aminopeptidase
MSVDSPEQLAGLKRAGRLVAATLRTLRGAVIPGITTGELDAIAADCFAAHGARSGPILTHGFPGSISVSVGDEVVHGIPGPRMLREGELVTLDVAAELDGYHADAAVTVAVGSVDHQANRLIAAIRAALAAGIRAAQPGANLRDVGGSGSSSRSCGSSRWNTLTALTPER